MSWWNEFQAIFFDLDGLLVNTEALHWIAYKDMCAENGVNLPWSFDFYYSLASRSASGVHSELLRQFPELFKMKSWEALYQEKRKNYRIRMQEGVIPMMPGVEKVLDSLQDANIPIAVVTHSPQEFVDHISKQHRSFSVIQRWFARESYLNPKPAADGYIAACQFFDVEPEKTVGFEDSLRGIEALEGAKIRPILVQKFDQEARLFCMKKGITVYSTIDEVL